MCATMTMTYSHNGPGDEHLDRRVCSYRVPITNSATAAAASACMPGITWAYCFSVNAGVSWPRRSLITFTGTPALSAIVA